MSEAKHNYRCLKCGYEFDEFREDNYAGSDILLCGCGGTDFLDLRTGKPVERDYNLPGIWR